MGSSTKKRTTMAKLNRESKLREKRADKEVRRTMRKLAAANNGGVTEPGEYHTEPSLSEGAPEDEPTP